MVEFAIMLDIISKVIVTVVFEDLVEIKLYYTCM